jgi:hypothetical protein
MDVKFNKLFEAETKKSKENVQRLRGYLSNDEAFKFWLKNFSVEVFHLQPVQFFISFL